MNTPTRPRLKSITSPPPGPHAAPQAADTTVVGEPKDAARKGVQTSPNPRTGGAGNPTPDRPGIRIYATPVYRHPHDGARWSKRYGDTPSAAYACPCGHAGTAIGADRVAALLADYERHRDTCPLRNHQEGRAAA
ncbi:hypothetical protein [Streptomyces sp. NPDC047108]|uniref:hypothetical protein n=1 Tax=Streptomyces sp. NPDC047108 TaxID=3155025 RepID=UPI003406BADC